MWWRWPTAASTPRTNIVPAHRQCNEIKGSEKAQFRASALDRWLDEWAGGGAEAADSANGERALMVRSREQEAPLRLMRVGCVWCVWRMRENVALRR